jgi:hypothetical protein
MWSSIKVGLCLFFGVVDHFVTLNLLLLIILPHCVYYNFVTLSLLNFCNIVYVVILLLIGDAIVTWGLWFYHVDG